MNKLLRVTVIAWMCLSAYDYVRAAAYTSPKAYSTWQRCRRVVYDRPMIAQAEQGRGSMVPAGFARSEWA